MAEPYPTSIEDLAKAIATAEHGKDKINSGEIPNNNPGNIKDFKTGKFVNYPTLEKGWDALKNQASKFFSGSKYYNPEMTIKEIAGKYVGTSDAPNWAKNVASYLGVTPYTKLKEMTQSSLYDTKLSSKEEQQFKKWKQQYAPNDSGFDYDLRGAFKEGLTPDTETGHWPDTYKKPNHPTFSDESKYAVGENSKLAGHWTGPNHDQFISPMKDQITQRYIDTLIPSGSTLESPQGGYLGTGYGAGGTISPRQGILEKARDMMYSTGPGRGLMDIVDRFNKVTGGPDLGNVAPNIAPGASHAITPFLENMVKEGIIKKTANLFGEDRALFMDKMGDVYDLGNAYTNPNSMTHEGTLSQAGKLPYTYSEGKPVGLDLPQALQNEDLTRIRRGGNFTGLEMSKMPSNAEMEQIMALGEANPKMQFGLDLHNLQVPRDYMNPTFMENPKAYSGIHLNSPNEVIDSIYKFFGK